MIIHVNGLDLQKSDNQLWECINFANFHSLYRGEEILITAQSMNVLINLLQVPGKHFEFESAELAIHKYNELWEPKLNSRVVINRTRDEYIYTLRIISNSRITVDAFVLDILALQYGVIRPIPSTNRVEYYREAINNYNQQYTTEFDILEHHVNGKYYIINKRPMYNYESFYVCFNDNTFHLLSYVLIEQYDSKEKWLRRG